MAKKKAKSKTQKSRPAASAAFLRATGAKTSSPKQTHVYGKNFVCDTDSRGFATPRDRSIFEIVVDASEGFIPLWARQSTLRWRFHAPSLKFFANPTKAQTEIRKLLGEALLLWGDAAPVKFAERDDLWDFEIAVQSGDKCNASGCVLASAFFPDAGRHQLMLFPKMFEQDRQEQLDTLVHEIGHVFGLRHFFAQISEKRWRSEIFGTHKPFSIMNYGAQSKLTADDKSDLKRLYQKVWANELTSINGTPIKLVKPFHTVGTSPDNAIAFTATQPSIQALPRVAFAAEARRGCLDLVSAGEIVQAAVPGGPHDVDLTLEEAGLISDGQRTVFQEDVVSGVEGRGCRIRSGDVPNDADTTLDEAREAVRDNAFR